MRKHYFGRQFKRDTNERKALFKGLASSLVIYERIQTTEEKAKAVKPQVEKLVTTAKRGDSHAHSLLQPYLNAEALKKMLTDIGPRFKDRPGGYTRIIKMGTRLQDNASVVILEWVEKAPTVTAVVADKKTKNKEQKTKNEKVETKVAIEKETKRSKVTRSTSSGQASETKEKTKKKAVKKGK